MAALVMDTSFGALVAALGSLGLEVILFIKTEPNVTPEQALGAAILMVGFVPSILLAQFTSICLLLWGLGRKPARSVLRRWAIILWLLAFAGLPAWFVFVKYFDKG